MTIYARELRGVTDQLLLEIRSGQGITLAAASLIQGKQPNGRPYRKRHLLDWIELGF
jgi:hypothetical protein